MNMIRFLVALFLTFGLPLFAAQSNYVPVIGTQPVSPVIYAANPIANFATTNLPAALTNIIRDLAGTNSGGSGSYIQNRGGFGTNTAFFDRSTTDTNSFHAYGAGDPLANGVYFLAGHFPASQLTVYTNENKSGYAVAYAGPVNVGQCNSDNFTLYSATNGDPCNGDWPSLYFTSATNVAWTVDTGTSPAPTLAGWGQFYPAITVAGSIIGNGGGLTNINAAANNLAAVGGLAGTLSSPFIHIRTNGITINNTNWIYQGNVSGSRVTITNGDFYAYSTNGAFQNVRVFDQILFNDINVQAVVHQVISSSKVQCWQLDVESEGVSSGGVTNSANWYLIPYLLKLTDFTIGAENRPTVFDSNGSLRLTSIGNQGIVGFHHYANGTAMQIGAGSSILSGLQMGPNGMYFAISSVGSNFANADQFVMPSETLREAQVFATSGSPTFQYGVTNIKGGNFDIRVKAVGLAGFEGSGASLTNLPAQTNSNTALLNRDPQTFSGVNNFQTVTSTALNVTGAVGLNGPVNFTNTVTHQGLVTNAAGVYGTVQTNTGAIKASEFVGDGSKLTGVVAATGAIASTNGFGTNATFYSTGPPAISILPAPGQSGGTNTFGGANIMATNYAPIFTITNAIVLGTRYSNGPQRAFIRAAFTLNAAVAGTATVTLYVEGNVTNKLSISSGPLASLVVTDTLADEVGPGEVYYFADESSGSGATVAFVANTFARKLH